VALTGRQSYLSRGNDVTRVISENRIIGESVAMAYQPASMAKA